MFGLLDRDLSYIRKAALQFPEIEEVQLFGSRAMGNYKIGSDIDIAVLGNLVDDKTVRRLMDLLNEEYPIPYYFDIVNYQTLSNDALKRHIEEYGQALYQKQNVNN